MHNTISHSAILQNIQQNSRPIRAFSATISSSLTLTYGVWRLFNDVLGHSYSASGHTDCQFLWPIVQDTAAPTTHDKPGSLTCPLCSTDTGTREHTVFPGKNQYIGFLVILVGLREIELALTGSAVKCLTTEPCPLTNSRVTCWLEYIAFPGRHFLETSCEIRVFYKLPSWKMAPRVLL